MQIPHRVGNGIKLVRENVLHSWKLDWAQRAQTSANGKISTKSDPGFDPGFLD